MGAQQIGHDMHGILGGIGGMLAASMIASRANGLARVQHGARLAAADAWGEAEAYAMSAAELRVALAEARAEIRFLVQERDDMLAELAA